MMNASERCPRCVIAGEGQYPPILCRALGKPLETTKNGDIIRAGGCPRDIRVETDIHCNVFPGRTVPVVKETRYGTNGKKITIKV